MRKTNGILAVAAVALAVVAFGQPAQANCAAPALMQTTGGGTEMQIASNPAWADGTFGQYLADGGAPISPNFSGFFWALGSGAVAIGAGNDNGAYPSSAWVERRVAGDYYYAAYMRQPGGGVLNWTTPGVDGCILGTGACACVLFSDEWNGQGFIAVLGDNPDTQLNYDFGVPGASTFRLAPTPKPVIQSAAREPGTNNLLLQVTVPPLTGGLYQTGGCNCIAGFKVFANVVPRGGMPPTGRQIAADGWIEVANTSGQPQGVTPIGGSAAVRVDCGATNTDVYLATQIMGDSGFGTQLVSENSTRIECGPTLADPIQRPRVPLNRPMPEGPGRGR